MNQSWTSSFGFLGITNYSIRALSPTALRSAGKNWYNLGIPDNPQNPFVYEFGPPEPEEAPDYYETPNILFYNKDGKPVLFHEYSDTCWCDVTIEYDSNGDVERIIHQTPQ